MLVFPARSTKLVEAWLSVDHQYTLTGLLIDFLPALKDGDS